MSWKIYHIETGRILKAGFVSEEEAKESLESRVNLSFDDYIVEEMDDDEEFDEDMSEEEELGDSDVEAVTIESAFVDTGDGDLEGLVEAEVEFDDD